MQRRSNIYILLWISILLVAGLSCNLFSNLEQAAEVKDTAEAVLTQADVGVETVQALVTDIEAKITESGIVETVQAVATDLPIATLQGEKPEDIPVIEGDKTALIESENLVTYTIDIEFQVVIDFYEEKMPANGWVKNVADSSLTDNIAQLVFEKDGRRATVMITKVPFLNQVNVSITID